MTQTTATQAPAAASGPITLDDVRTAIEGTDPNTTNASKVRGLLGNRGSFETIQKHLNTLRAELAAAAAPPVFAGAVPAVPTEAVNQIWVAAWTAAQVSTLARSEKLAGERDAALLKLETMRQDVAGLVVTVDEQGAELERAAKEFAEYAGEIDKADALAKAARLAEQERTAADHAHQVAELETVRQALAKAQSEGAHAAELAEQGRDIMRGELQRLTDQVGELKAALYRRAESAPVSPSPSPAG